MSTKKIRRPNKVEHVLEGAVGVLANTNLPTIATHELDGELANALGFALGPLDVKSWRLKPDPWVFKSTSGKKLGQLENIGLALTLNQFNSPPYFRLQSHLSYAKRTHGYHCLSWGRENLLTVQLLDKNSIPIYTYIMEGGPQPGSCELIIECSDHGRLFWDNRKIDSNIFDDVMNVNVHKNGGTWYPC